MKILCGCERLAYHLYGRGAVDWKEIFMKQSVGKCKYINF